MSGTTGDRYFWCNQAGQIFYTGQKGAAPAALNAANDQTTACNNYVVLGK